ncbi:HotDog domain-containing protein [Biscogniauxia marginata]|nr:HotDog domain-containing protein [Biscogniauxia marginata]
MPPSSSPSSPPQDHNQHTADPLTHFGAIPWCAARLSSPRVLPGTASVPDRRPLASGEASFVRKTMNSGTTFLRGGSAEGKRGIEEKEEEEEKANGEDPRNPFLVFNALVDLGEDCNSYVATMHGGLYGVLMDEVMGTAANQQSPHGAYTVKFQTEYRRQVRTPQVVLVRGRVTRREGRKIWVRGVIEDKDGNIMAEGSGLWLSMGKNVGRSQL